jgi:DtxR family manganese transport transcriptional regulator
MPRQRSTRPTRDAATSSPRGESNRYRRTRQDHASETAEDYVELIRELIQNRGEARTVEIARRLGVSHVTVNRTVARLRKAGLVRAEPYRAILLTDAGRALAARAESRHATVLAFLLKLGVARRDAEADAEGIEHHLSNATLLAMSRYLSEPPSPLV